MGKENIIVSCAINLTAHELIDRKLMEWIHNIIDSTNIDRSRIELEITERVINKESEKLIKD